MFAWSRLPCPLASVYSTSSLGSTVSLASVRVRVHAKLLFRVRRPILHPFTILARVARCMMRGSSTRDGRIASSSMIAPLSVSAKTKDESDRRLAENDAKKVGRASTSRSPETWEPKGWFTFGAFGPVSQPPRVPSSFWPLFIVPKSVCPSNGRPPKSDGGSWTD